jgi:3-deoxy-7-phosphoheptulonate synthase
VTKAGHSAIVSTLGNDDSHIILRGGKKPNYDAGSVGGAAQALEDAGLRANIMIDFSHANSLKDPERQPLVARDVADQIAQGDDRIFGVMIESHLNPGNQSLESGKPLAYGVSITDACLGWEASEAVLHELAHAVAARRKHNELDHSAHGNIHVAIH